MKQLRNFYVEEEGDRAHKQAVSMGLKYKGFGYWVDPVTGVPTHKVDKEKDILVPIEDTEGEKFQGQSPEAPMGAPGDAAKKAVKGSFGAFVGNGQQPAAVTSGEVLPGAEKSPKENNNSRWEPGPDGNTCVNDQPAPDVEVPDLFVGKTNYMNWTAGPEGSNYANIDMKQMYASILGKQTSVNEQLNEDIADNLKDFASNGFTGKRIVDKIKSNQPSDPSSGTGTFDREPPELQSTGTHPSQIKNQNRPKPDASVLDKLNQGVQSYVSDPDYDLDDFDDEEEIASGAFGQVFKGKGGSVIKRGDIGIDELKALYMMKNNKNFPTLLNARLDGPFVKGGSMFDDDEESEEFDSEGNPATRGFIDGHMQAPGTFAMSTAKGQPIRDAMYDMDPIKKGKLLKNLMRARAQMHMSGISHNDMHSGNVFADDDGEVNILDMGLAQANPLSALSEGIAGSTRNDGQFAQIQDEFNFREIGEQMRGNIEAVRDQLLDNIEGSDDEEDTSVFDAVENFFEGGIRKKGKEYDKLKEMIPYLQDDKNVLKMISRMYQGIGGTDTQNRMSNAFDKRQADSRVIKAANAIRARRGESPIDVRNRNVVPPENLDFDN